MGETCPECGVRLPPNSVCRDLFDALLALEFQTLREHPELAGEEGQAAHFYAVSCYVLQHQRWLISLFW